MARPEKRSRSPSAERSSKRQMREPPADVETLDIVEQHAVNSLRRPSPPERRSAMQSFGREILEDILKDLTHHQLRDACKAGSELNYVAQQYLFRNAVADVSSLNTPGKAHLSNIGRMFNFSHSLSLHVPTAVTKAQTAHMQTVLQDLVSRICEQKNEIEIISLTPESHLDSTMGTIFCELLRKTKKARQIFFPQSEFDCKSKHFASQVGAWIVATARDAEEYRVPRFMNLVIAPGADLRQVKAVLGRCGIQELSLFGKKADSFNAVDHFCSSLGFSHDSPLAAPSIQLSNIALFGYDAAQTSLTFMKVTQLQLSDCTGVSGFLETLGAATVIERMTVSVPPKHQPQRRGQPAIPTVAIPSLEAGLRAFLSGNETLKELSICTAAPMDIISADMIPLLPIGLRLLCLRIGGDDDLDEEDMTALVDRCPHLQALAVNSYLDKPDQWRRPIPRPTHNNPPPPPLDLFLTPLSQLQELQYITFFTEMNPVTTSARELGRVPLTKRAENKATWMTRKFGRVGVRVKQFSAVFWCNPSPATRCEAMFYQQDHSLLYDSGGLTLPGPLPDVPKEVATERKRVLTALSVPPVRSLGDLAKAKQMPFQLRHERDFVTKLGYNGDDA